MRNVLFHHADFLKNITADDLGLKNVIVAFEKVTVLKSGDKNSLIN